MGQRRGEGRGESGGQIKRDNGEKRPTEIYGGGGGGKLSKIKGSSRRGEATEKRTGTFKCSSLGMR